MLKKLKNLFGNENERILKRYREVVETINALEPQVQQLKDEQFPEKTRELKQRIAERLKELLPEGYPKSKNHKQYATAKEILQSILDEVLPEAFALVREASVRINNERHYDVQLMGGIALHEGNIAEMQTGEGKTLSSTCPVYLNALAGKGVHIITPNDYLAKRDSEWMGKIYHFLGLTIGVIQHGFADEERRENYQKDITYGTNNEFGFDYLRDNMKFDLKHYVQREFYFSVVDEVDSILIDEARTPLIISGPTDDNIDKYYIIDKIIRGLKHQLVREIRKEEVQKLTTDELHGIDADWEQKEDNAIVRDGEYSLDEKARSITLTDLGAERIEGKLKGILAEDKGLFDYENIEILHYVNQSMKAHFIFKRDIDYVVQDNQVVIVDEFTGRMMPGRRFSDGLHQSLEAKEGVTIERENQTLATITFQNYFRLYDKLSGMTGTAETEKEEFQKIYNLGVVVIPTNRPIARIDNSDVIYKSVQAKHRAIVRKIQELHAKGQPVLVGTVSIETSEQISRMLKQQGIPHEVLNAKHHEREAEIISKAGHLGSVTIATNMAGRGTDIKPAPASIEAGGLFVLGTGRHDSRRIDNQLRGRSGRQGDVGESLFFLSLEDDLLRIFGGERISNIMDKLKIEEDEPIEHVFISKAIENAQKKVETHHFEIRKHVLEYDDVMEKQRNVVYTNRRDILAHDPKPILLDMSDQVVEMLMEQYCDHKFTDQWDISGMTHNFKNTFHHDPPTDWYEISTVPEEILQEFYKQVEWLYEQKRAYFLSVMNDGESSNEEGSVIMVSDITRQILLRSYDTLWKDHLLSMDHLREGIGLVGYAQKKPLDEYKKQAFELFTGLIDRIYQESVTTFFSLQLAASPEIAPQPEPLPQNMTLSHGDTAEEEAKNRRDRRAKKGKKRMKKKTA